MKRCILVLLAGITGCWQAEGQPDSTASINSGTNSPTIETIICIRHGEKPHGGLGQLTNRGLNRSLALPRVLLKRYGKPQFIFAPNPTHKVDGNPGYYYVRPLATIEPTAIQCGLPVNTEFGYDEIKQLEKELARPQYQNATVFVAWEHGLLDQFARNMVKDHAGDPREVPGWQNDEYDMIFVFKITNDNGQNKFSFAVEHEGLNGLADQYPSF
jgi:hypothetical protein